MSIERINDLRKIKHWHGDMEVAEFVYTVGLAGEKFFRALKEGKILASKCKKCDITYLPARAFCERCHSEINEYIEITESGWIYTYTIQHVDKNGKKLEEPVIWAIIKFDGVEGGILHKLGEIDPEDVEIGMEVTPVFKEQSEREGKITDIKYFKPI